MPTEIYGPVSQGPGTIPVPVTQGGTGTTTQFTQGSVVFAGAAGVYSQDNATLFHDDAGNKNGVGTNLPSVTLEVADTTVLGSESLTNPNLTGGASWSVTGQCVLAADAMTYTHGGTNAGTLTQAAGTLAIAGVANNLYSFTYTISGLSAFVNIPVVTITTAFALTAVPLVINTAGVHTVIFRSAAVPGNFVISITSASAGAFTMDTFSLKHVIGGNLTVNGNAQVNGTLTATALSGPLTGNVTGNVSGTAATVTGAAQTNITSVGTLSGLTVTAAPTFSALTQGSVPFAGAAGLLSQDNATLFWDNSTKRLGVGTAAPFKELDVYSTGAVTETRVINIPANNTSLTTTVTNSTNTVDLNVSGNAVVPKFTISFAGTPKVTIANDGTTTLSKYGAGAATFDASGNISSVSDERLKNIQGQFKTGLVEVLKITPILYRWNELSKMETEHTYAGFSAQNVQAAIPEAVGEDTEGYLSLQDRALLAACVNAIKELNDKIDKLTNKEP